MQSIQDILKTKEPKLKKSERAQVISEIYEVYLKDTIGRKKENWRRYVKWCKDNRFAHNKENLEKFRESKFLLKEMKVSQICYFLSHIPTKDLYFTRSEVKDKLNRGENVGGYLLSSVKIQ